MYKILYAVAFTLSAAFHSCTTLSLEEFVGYPFNRYSKVQNVDDGIEKLQIENVSFPFLGKHFDYLQIDTNGHIDFSMVEQYPGSLYNVVAFPEIHRYALAPYAFDLHNGREGSEIFYSIYNTTNEITVIEDDIDKAVRASQDKICSRFKPTWALVVTYRNIGFFAIANARVTFQVILVTDGYASFAIFNYDQGVEVDFSGPTYPSIGYTTEMADVYFSLPDSIVQNIYNSIGNSGIAGQWVFRIDQGSINVRIGDDLFLDCSVQNVDLNSNFQWHRNGLPLEETETVMNTTSSRLVVKNISNSDLGHYECTYNNMRMRGNNVNESDTFLSTFKVGLEQCKGALLCSCMKGIFFSLEELSYGNRTGPLGLIVQEQPGISMKILLPVLLNSTSTFELPVDAKIHTINFDCFNADLLTLATYQSEVDYSLFPNIHTVIQPLMRLIISLNSRLLSRLELRGMMTLYRDSLNIVIDATNSSFHSFTAIKSNSTSGMSTGLISLLDNGFGITIPSTPLSSQLAISNISLQGNVERSLPGMYQLSAALNGDTHIGDWYISDVTVIILLSEGREHTASVFIITGFHSLQSISLLAFLRNAYGSDISSTTFFNNMILTDYFISYASENFTISQAALTKLQLPPSLPFEASAFRGFNILFNFNTSQSGHTSNFTRWIFNYERSIITFYPLALVTDGVSVGNMLLLISGNDSVISPHHILLETVHSHSVKMMHLNAQANSVSIHVDIMGVEVRQQEQAIVFKDIELTIPLHLDATPKLQTFSISKGLENFLS